MTITRFLEHLDRTIPLRAAMQDDPVGLQVMAKDYPLTKIAVAYELNEAITAKAADMGAELIVAFHPLIYPHLRSITGKNRVERTVIDLLDNRIALYVLHTAFDAHPRGSSRLLAEGLGCTEMHPLVPDPVIEGGGMGTVGTFDVPLPLPTLALLLKEVCSASVVRMSVPPGKDEERMISSVAILAGSGMSFYKEAIASGADAFITADTRYHAFHAANDDIPILDPGHAESEAFVVQGMNGLIETCVEESGERIEVTTITDSTNPVRYIV